MGNLLNKRRYSKTKTAKNEVNRRNELEGRVIVKTKYYSIGRVYPFYM